MFEEADNLADFFRGSLYILLPILIISLSSSNVAASEFPVFRMSQFDLNGVPYGCRSSALNLEAKSLYTWTTSRQCVVARFQDMTIDHFRDITKKAGAAGLVVQMPENVAKLSLEEKQHIHLLEKAMLAQETSIPVYFSKYSKQLDEVIDDITARSSARDRNAPRESAIKELFGSVSANGYQIVVSGASHTATKNPKIPIIQGELAPMKAASKNTESTMEANSKLPLIIVAAHMNAFGLINEHLSNYDVAISLTLIDLFSKLNSFMSTSPKYRLQFVITEAGHFLNFQGTKKWLDVNVDENMQLQHTEFVLCLDSVGKAVTDNQETSIYMHVSKPPKEGTNMYNFYKLLRETSQKYGTQNPNVEGVHKKINLADAQLSWEHERFSMKRLPAFTLSSLKSPTDPLRTTIFREDITEEQQDQLLDDLTVYCKVIAESLARYVYNIEDGEIFTGTMAVTKEQIKPWLNIKSTQLNNDLKSAFEKYLKNVKISYEKPDAREPDFMLYEGHEATMNVYNVKPAVFDLFLTSLIAAYLVTIYFAILYFPKLYTALCHISVSQYEKVKTN